MFEFSRTKEMKQAKIKFISSCRISRNIQFAASESVNRKEETCS